MGINSSLEPIAVTKQEPVFYLKIHHNTDEALRCFDHWVDIVSEMGAEFYVVCDNVELINRIGTIQYDKPDYLKIIPSYLEQAKEILDSDIIDHNSRWINVGAALLTPFLHAKENDFDNFWNIDADDSMLLLDAQTCARALRKASEYGNKNNIDCLSLDFYATWFSNGLMPYWTFGVTYTKNKCDYVGIIKNLKELVQKWKSIPKRKEIYQIDQVFSYLGYEGLIKTKSFSIVNMGFKHGGNRQIWRFDRLEILRLHARQIVSWNNLNGNTIVRGMPLSESLIKIDVDISENQSREWSYKNNLEGVYYDSLEMLEVEFEYLLKFTRDMMKNIKLLENENKTLTDKLALLAEEKSKWSDMQTLLTKTQSLFIEEQEKSEKLQQVVTENE